MESSQIPHTASQNTSPWVKDDYYGPPTCVSLLILLYLRAMHFSDIKGYYHKARVNAQYSCIPKSLKSPVYLIIALQCAQYWAVSHEGVPILLSAATKEIQKIALQSTLHFSDGGCNSRRCHLRRCGGLGHMLMDDVTNSVLCTLPVSSA